MSKSSAETPLMRQYHQFKSKQPDAILLFRIGDFYETFGQDAVKTSAALGIVLTKRANGSAAHIELAGFPYHALDNYLPKLVKAGHRVAICEQLEDPKLAKGIVKRGITEIITPGITLNEKILEHNQNNYLASFFFTKTGQTACAFLDLSVGDFFYYTGSFEKTEKIISHLKPAELVLSKPQHDFFKEQYNENTYLFRLDDWVFEKNYAGGLIKEFFNVEGLKGLGLHDEDGAVIAVGALIHYLKNNEIKSLPQVHRIYQFDDEEYLAMDRFTVRNLELIYPLHPDGKSLYQTLNHTATPPGARLLKKWLLFPLRNMERVNNRLDKTQDLIFHPDLLEQLNLRLREIGDTERMISRLATAKINPKEASALRNALLATQKIVNLLTETLPQAAVSQIGSIETAEKVFQILNRTLTDEPALNFTAGEVIRSGVHPELDELRNLKADMDDFLEEIKQREAKRTGISSLKINFNKVSGFYIEITHTHKNKVPNDYIRKQTLTNCERFITPELKDYEEKFLNAEERILELEQLVYTDLITRLLPEVPELQRIAYILSELDVFHSFAKTALKYRYNRPNLDSSSGLQIRQGRHPVIESLLDRDNPYIPNDIHLQPQADTQILLITGPNMAGKSALLRQTALTVLLAQAGSFVPAESAEIGLIDKIFTRVGASDNLSAGESTFMVEMSETARILHQATDKSLVILDEIGRGTGTYDGVSIAWALVEYLHESGGQQAKTLFATHYHELSELEKRFPRIKNMNVAAKEINGKLIFLRKLIPGSGEKSFGIQVAEMAGLPAQVISRAKELLQSFESSDSLVKIPKNKKKQSSAGMQSALFEVKDESGLKIKKMLREIEINQISPMEALMKLVELKNLAEK